MAVARSSSSIIYGSSCLDVFRKFHHEICSILAVNPDNLARFAGILYSKKLVDISTKNGVKRINGYEGADALLDNVSIKLKCVTQLTQRYGMLLEAIEEVEALSDVREHMEIELQKASSDTNRDRIIGRISIVNVTGSITDAESFAKHLKNSFQEFVVIINTAITTTADVNKNLLSELRVRIDIFFSSECPGQYTTDNSILSKLDACSTAEGILRCLIRHNFIGYLNYKLLEVFVKASGSDPTLKASIEEYEQEYLKLFKCDFHSIIRLFCNPILAPVVPAFSLPDFSIRLGTKLEESSVYELKELFQNHFPWAEHLVILDVTKNCVLIKYGVLPFFISAVVRDLTDPTVIEELKKEDITIELSTELMKYSITSLSQQIPPSPILEREFSSSDVVQFLRTHDVAITDRQKTQLQQQRRLTSAVTEDHESIVASDDRQSLEAIAEGLEALPMKKVISDWDEHGGDKNSSSGFHEDLQVLHLNIREDSTHAEKNFVYEKALKQLLAERKTTETKHDMLKKMAIELEETKLKLSRAEKQLQEHEEHSSPTGSADHSTTTTVTASDFREADLFHSDHLKPTVMSMSLELKNLIDWESFALYLPNITMSDIQKIKAMNHQFFYCKEALFIHWLSVYPDASWEDVFQALKNAKELSLAYKILDRYIDIPLDTEHILPLTITSMDNQLRDLVQWELFAHYLPGITQYHINTIKQESSSLRDQKIALYECWLSQYSRASWSHVITALRKSGQYRLAQNIVSSLHQTEMTKERLLDPPDLVTFMKRVASKAPGDCHYVALHLLSPDGYRNFKAKSRDQELDIWEKYELCFEMWKKEEADMSWSIIITALKYSNNHSLAKQLDECFF